MDAFSARRSSAFQVSRQTQNEHSQYRTTMGHGKNDLGSRWRRENVSPILTTKLYLPRLRPNVVSRPRLLDRLNEGLHCKLTLISAPAGFGKTTLVSEWLAGGARPVAWLSLDKE